VFRKVIVYPALLRSVSAQWNATPRALLADLVERGLATDRSLLIVIDGAKALHKAVVEVLGAIDEALTHRALADATYGDRLRQLSGGVSRRIGSAARPGKARSRVGDRARRVESDQDASDAELPVGGGAQ
jgi:hypothetical protein